MDDLTRGLDEYGLVGCDPVGVNLIDYHAGDGVGVVVIVYGCALLGDEAIVVVPPGSAWSCLEESVSRKPIAQVLY